MSRNASLFGANTVSESLLRRTSSIPATSTRYINQNKESSLETRSKIVLSSILVFASAPEEIVGTGKGNLLESTDGASDGNRDGTADGVSNSETDGALLGNTDGREEGISLGTTKGVADGFIDGT